MRHVLWRLVEVDQSPLVVDAGGLGACGGALEVRCIDCRSARFQRGRSRLTEAIQSGTVVVYGTVQFTFFSIHRTASDPGTNLAAIDPEG